MRKLDNPILREVGALARTLHTRCDVKFKALRLQKGQFVFLTRVCEHPGVSLMQLSKLVRVDKTATTKAVQKLEAQGYVVREADPVDARAQRLKPTAAALRAYDQIIAEENASLQKCFRGFGTKEIATALALVQRLRENLEAAP